jgi:hypothetical protein
MKQSFEAIFSRAVSFRSEEEFSVRETVMKRPSLSRRAPNAPSRLGLFLFQPTRGPTRKFPVVWPIQHIDTHLAVFGRKYPDRPQKRNPKQRRFRASADCALACRGSAAAQVGPNRPERRNLPRCPSKTPQGHLVPCRRWPSMPDPDLIRFVEAQDAVRRPMVGLDPWRS